MKINLKFMDGLKIIPYLAVNQFSVYQQPARHYVWTF